MDIVIARHHLHPIIDHFTIALFSIGVLSDLFGYLISWVSNRCKSLGEGLAARLSGAAPVLIVLGAIASVFSGLTGESEAERVWDSISPAAQQILFADRGVTFLSHAVLGTYLMYAFAAIAAWRLALDIWPSVEWTRFLYMIFALAALTALLYQGKTGGELVYDHGVGTPRAAITSHSAEISPQPVATVVR